MKFWKGEDWKDLKKQMSRFDDLTPSRKNVFRPLIETPLKKLKVVILGRNPHIKPWHNDGLAFSCPVKTKDLDDLPYETAMMLTEYYQDIQPNRCAKTGSLRKWAKNGVLLWNMQPFNRLPYPHIQDFNPWDALTEEILDTAYLYNPSCVFVFFEPTRQAFNEDYLPDDAIVITEAGPWKSTARTGFLGSRIFSRINEELLGSGRNPINWQL